MKKRRKPKPRLKGPPAPDRRANPPGVALPQPVDSRWSKIFKVIGGIATLLGLLFTALHFWPQINVEPTAPAEPSNPLSGYFKVTNEQVYALTDVSIEASLRCAKIGRGIDTTPPDRCEPSMHTSKQRWMKHVLQPHESYEISPGDLIFVTPGALLYAQISIFITYQPWKLPVHMNKELRFETRRLSNGAVEWLHIPAE